MPPRITKEAIQEAAKQSNLSVRDYINKLPDSYLSDAATQSNIDVSQYRGKLADAWGEAAVQTDVKKKETTSPTIADTSQTGIVNTSQSKSNSASPLVGSTLQNQTENQLIPKAFSQAPPVLTPNQKLAAAALQETKDTENDIKSWMTDPNGGTIDTQKPTTSKYNNAKQEALKSLTATSNDLALIGQKPIDVQAVINNPENFPDVVTKIKGYYDKKIEDNLTYQHDLRLGERITGTGKDNERTIALKSERDKALKNIGLLRDIAIVRKNPDATAENVGSEILKSDDPIAYSNLQVAPNMTSVNYRKKKMGLEAKLAAAAIDIESGTATPEQLAKASKIITDGKNLVYDFPDIRKGQLRQMVMEGLATKDKLGGFINDEAAKKALGEIDDLIANPVNPKDIPLLKQMKDDLDFGLGKNIMSDAFVNVPNAEAKYNKYLKEREQYKGQSALENFGAGLGGTFTETAKWIAGKTGLRSDAERLSESDAESVGTKNYDPKKYQFQVPKYTVDINENSPTRGQMVANPDAGDFNLRAVPYKAANGMGQLAGQLVLGELAGAGVAATVGRALEFGGDAVSGVIGSANSIKNATTAAAKAIEMDFKIMGPAYAMSYDQNRKEALKMFGSDKAADWKVDAYTNAASLLEGLTEKIGNPYEQFGMVKSVFKKEVKDELSRNIAGLSIRQIENMSRPTLQKFFEGAVKAVGQGVKNVTGEAAEEWLNAYGQYGAAALLGADVSQRSGLDEANHAFIDAAASMSFLGAAGTFTGARDYYSNSGFAQQAMFDIGSNADTYRDAILKQNADGILDDKERDQKLNLVNSAENAKKEWDKVKQYVKPSADITQAAKKGVNYVQAKANELALQKEHDLTSDGGYKKKLLAQISKWQKVQDALIDMPVDFNTDAVPVLPAVTSNGLVEVRAPNIEAVPIELQAQAVETVNHQGVPEVVFFVPNQDTPSISVIMPKSSTPAVATTKDVSTNEDVSVVNPTMQQPVIVGESVSVTLPQLSTENQQNEVAKKLAQQAALRDKANNEIQLAYQDNVQEPDAWVKPYEAARQAQDEMVVQLATPITATETAQITAPQNEELSKKLGSIRNDDFMRQYFNEEDNAAYEKADEQGKIDLIKAKKTELLNGGTTATVNQPLPANEGTANQQGNKGTVSTGSSQTKRPDESAATPISINKSNDNELNKESSGISYMGGNEAAMPEPESIKVSSLRRERDSYITGLEIQLREISDRYGAEAKPESYTGQDRQRWELLQRELQMVNEGGAIPKQNDNKISGLQGGADAVGVTNRPIGNEAGDNLLSSSASKDDTGRNKTEASENSSNVNTQRANDDNKELGETNRDRVKFIEMQTDGRDGVVASSNNAKNEKPTPPKADNTVVGEKTETKINEEKTNPASLPLATTQENSANKEADSNSSTTEGEKGKYTKAAKLKADKFRQKFTQTPISFKDKDGNEIQVSKASFIDLIEVAAKAIEATGKVIDGFIAARDYLQSQDWFKALSDDNKAAVVEQVDDYFSDFEGQITKDESVRVILERELDPKEFPTLFNAGGNLTLKQEAAITQGEGQQREVDGPYVVAMENDLRQISLSNAALLQELLGDNWTEQTVDYIERNPNGGNIANIVGILNVISTDTFNKIAAATKSSELNSLKAFQNRVDLVAIQSARRASLALNMRRLYAKFAMGESIGSIMSDRVLNENEKEFLTALQQTLVEPVSEAEINSVPDTPKPATPKRKQQRKTESEKRQKKTSRGKNSAQANEIITNAAKASERTAENGEKKRMSFKELAAIAKEKINKIKC